MRYIGRKELRSRNFLGLNYILLAGLGQWIGNSNGVR